ncbi:MAG: sugar nucleotide-binding protein, partial [Candidatus Gracilibacteria bacterium]
SRPEFGLYHLANEGFVGRYEYAKEIIEFAGLKTIVKKAEKSIAADGSKKIAARPHFSILKSTKIKSLRHFREALKVYLDLIKNRGKELFWPAEPGVDFIR